MFRGKKIHQSEVKINAWRRIPYEEIEKTLKEGNGLIYFIEGLKRQTAHGAARTLTRRLGFQVEAHKATYSKAEGYVFIKGTMEELEKRGETQRKRI